MFKYPSGRTLMNTTIWLIGFVQLLVGVLMIAASFAIDLSNYIPTDLINQVSPQLAMLLEGGSIMFGLAVLVSSFPTLLFADIHMNSVQTNKMMKKMYEKIK